MTDWLVSKFVKNSDDVRDASVRSSYGMLASVVCIVCNVVLCLAKGAIGLLAGSVSIVADAMNNLSDASSNIISLLGFKMANRKADEEHPYGHGRYEYLAGLVIAMLVVIIGIELIRQSVQRVMHPSPAEFDTAVVAVMLLSIATKSWMACFNNSLAKKIDSKTLKATATDSRNDVITTAAVLATSAFSFATGIDLDGAVGIIVGAFIVWGGLWLVHDTIDPLLGNAPDPNLVLHIRTKIMSYPGVLGTHDLMVHDYGPGRLFASAHVEMAAETDPLDSHDLLDNIEADFRDEGIPMVLHYDPIVTSNSAACDMRHWLAGHIKEVDSALTVHDVRLVPGPTHTNVIFDVVKPHSLAMDDDELRRRISEVVVATYPEAICKITVDTSYVSAE